MFTITYKHIRHLSNYESIHYEESREIDADPTSEEAERERVKLMATVERVSAAQAHRIRFPDHDQDSAPF